MKLASYANAAYALVSVKRRYIAKCSRAVNCDHTFESQTHKAAYLAMRHGWPLRAVTVNNLINLAE